MRVHVLAATVLFATAVVVRWWFLQGLILGDDPQEFAVLLHILANGPLLTDQLHVRFAGWIFNHLAFVLFGVSETAFLAPTWILTSTLPIMAYAILVRWRYTRLQAFLGGLLVATAPFEVVLGTVRANDSYLELAIAAGFTALVLLEGWPIWQGIALAVCLWFGFYVKLWVVYALPALGLYYLVGRRWRGAIAFTIASLVVHAATCLYWHRRVGTYFPFISTHAANYAVHPDQLVELFLKYVRLMFVGSFEFPTTLWGAVPWVVVVLLVVKIVASVAPSWPASLHFDRGDRLLLALYGSFFLLLEFFPNGFQLDAYYSVPRIFRYLAPISFPIALHAAKLLLDLARVPFRAVRPATAALAVGTTFLVVNLLQSDEATSPGRNYRENLHAVLHDVRMAKPPMLLAEAIIASYFRDLYFDLDEQATEVVILNTEHSAAEYEEWLHAREPTLPDGTMLITGLANFVHYGAHIDGYRLAWFKAPLSSRWKLVKEYGVLWYLPKPERARLWRLERPATTRPAQLDPPEDYSSLTDVNDPAALFKAGMKRYDANDYDGARLYFRKILDRFPSEGSDAAFFYAASFYRQANWQRARRAFKHLVRTDPHSTWVPAAYWHIFACEKNLGHIARARAGFRMIIRRFAYDPSAVGMAKQDLMQLRRRRGGILVDWWNGP